MVEKRSYAYAEMGHETRGTVSYSMRVRPDLCERILKDLRAAIPRIESAIEDFEDIAINSSLHTALSVFKSRLNKYALLGSDCSWQEYDTELAQCLDQIDMCTGVLMKKQKYRVSDVVYISRTLREIKERFEEKTEEYSELLEM